MKIAVISDIHANVYALEAVLSDIDCRRADVTVCLGDALYGPVAPAETFELLMSRDIKHVLGNSDRGLLSGTDDVAGTKYLVRAMVGEEQLNWIKGLPKTYSFGKFFFCHGTPLEDNVYLLYEVADGEARDRTDDELRGIVSGVPHPFVICGHSHLPRTRSVAACGKTVVNAGSVGLPSFLDKKPSPHKMESGNNNAKYAIIEESGDGTVSVEHVEVAYDFEKAAAAADSFGKKDWGYRIRTGRA